jgi:ABC-type dipeptide/oligopeptide/nickel transport system ATPase subunit
MRLQLIEVSGFLGIDELTLRLPKPINLICGSNGAGKSSIAHAVTLALTGHLSRVALKKDSGNLIRDGHTSAAINVQADAQDHAVSINQTGKITQKLHVQAPQLLLHALGAQRITALDVKQRLAVLGTLLDLSMPAAEVKRRLVDEGYPSEMIERIAPLLRTDIDAASAEAISHSTAAKGAWRATTGEAWGSVKANGWAAPTTPVDVAAVRVLVTEVKHATEALASWNRELGALKERSIARKVQEESVQTLGVRAASEAELRAQLNEHRKALAQLDAELDEVRAKTSKAPKHGLIHDLARALDAVCQHWHNQQPEEILFEGHPFMVANELMDRYEAEHGAFRRAVPVDQTLSQRLPELQRAQTALLNKGSQLERALHMAEQAAQQIQTLQAALAEPFDHEAWASAEAERNTVSAGLQDLTTKLQQAQSAVEANARADRATVKARQYHNEALAWAAIGERLSPSGIPMALMVERLTALNDRLAVSARRAGWAVPMVWPSMAITADQRDYSLLSTAERYRVDAMIAEAFSHFAGSRVLLLDGADVLDPSGRIELLDWLDCTVQANELDSALVMMTLRAQPASLPPSIEAHWITAPQFVFEKAAA